MRSYKNDASCINNKRGMARRAKRHSAHQERQFLKKWDKEWDEQIKPLLEKIRESEIITAEDLNRRIGGLS